MKQKLESVQLVNHISSAYPLGRYLADADKKCKRTLYIDSSAEPPQAAPSATCQQASHTYTCAGVYRIWGVVPQHGWARNGPAPPGVFPIRSAFGWLVPVLGAERARRSGSLAAEMPPPAARAAWLR